MCSCTTCFSGSPIRSGLFVDTPPQGQSTDPLLNSKHWLKLKDATAAQDAVEQQVFEDLGVAGTLLIGSDGMRHEIAVRIAPHPDEPLGADAIAKVGVAFGRPLLARQPFASPFKGGDNTQTFFDNDRPSSRQGGAYGWFISLGTIVVVPNHPNLTHRYEFAVGFNVSSGGITRSFGEDPEFDVGL